MTSPKTDVRDYSAKELALDVPINDQGPEYDKYLGREYYERETTDAPY